MLEDIKKENDKNRIKLLCKKYGKVLLKEGLYNRIMGKSNLCCQILDNKLEKVYRKMEFFNLRYFLDIIEIEVVR